MKNILIAMLFSLMLGLIISCNKPAAESGELVTKRIQYDVFIVSPDPEFDWWVQNIEGSGRETFVKNILSGASSGKVKVFDFFTYKPLAAEDIKNILRRVDTIALENPDPPHELRDTVLVKEIGTHDISKVRFMEEWYMNKESLVFSKKVIGICPLVEVFTENGDFKGNKPLFWVFFDDRYPAELK